MVASRKVISTPRDPAQAGMARERKRERRRNFLMAVIQAGLEFGNKICRVEGLNIRAQKNTPFGTTPLMQLHSFC